MRSSLQQTPDTLPHSVTGLLKCPALWHVILRAVLELALARYRLGRRNVRDVMGTTPARDTANTVTNLLADPLALRVAWAIPRVAARVPWRSDCLVQATAAQRWLASKRLDCELHIGVKKVSWNAPSEVVHQLGYDYPVLGGLNDGWKTRKAGRYRAEASAG